MSEAVEPVAMKKVYIKRLRTIVEIQAAYADQIRGWLNAQPEAVEAVWTVRDTGERDTEYDGATAREVLMPNGEWRGCIAVDDDDARRTMQDEWRKETGTAPPLAPDERMRGKESEGGDQPSTRRLDDLGSVQDGLKMSTDGHRADAGDMSDGRPAPAIPASHNSGERDPAVMPDSPGAGPSPAEQREAIARRWQHKKRGTTYTEIGRGRIQTDDWFIRGDERRDDTSVDMQEVVIYRSEHDGGLWVRPVDEFEDGRFVALSTRAGG